MTKHAQPNSQYTDAQVMRLIQCLAKHPCPELISELRVYEPDETVVAMSICKLAQLVAVMLLDSKREPEPFPLAIEAMYEMSYNGWWDETWRDEGRIHCRLVKKCGNKKLVTEVYSMADSGARECYYDVLTMAMQGANSLCEEQGNAEKSNV